LVNHDGELGADLLTHPSPQQIVKSHILFLHGETTHTKVLLVNPASFVFEAQDVLTFLTSQILEMPLSIGHSLSCDLKRRN
jgi:hypothetical protein